MIGPAYAQIPKKIKIAGAKAASKAISRGSAQKVLIAKDADAKIVANVVMMAKENNVEIVWVASMKQLGEYCNIGVGASCCVLLKPKNI